MELTTWIKPKIILILEIKETQKIGTNCDSIGVRDDGDNPCS